jgi:hypothetical protein
MLVCAHVGAEDRLDLPSELVGTEGGWRADLVASGLAVGGLSCRAFELLEDVLQRLVVADRMVDPALVVMACDDDSPIAESSSVPQMPRPQSAFVHRRDTSAESGSA